MLKLLYVLLACCISMNLVAQTFKVSTIERTRILVDSTYDAQIPEEAVDFLAPYKHVVDSMMEPVVGHVARSMKVYRPESPLSNLMADILMWASEAYGEKPDMAVYNMGGIRANLTKGEVTLGNVVDMAPFENKICFLTLSGQHLLELFQDIAQTKGEGLSKGVRMVMTKNKQLVSVTIKGKEIDTNGSYRIATIDYLAHGNDHLYAFKKKTDFVAPSDASNNTRELIANYFRAMEAKGIVVDSNVEGRVTVIK